MSFFKQKVSFSLNLYDCSVWWEITLLYFFSWSCLWFGQIEAIKVQNFRFLTAHVKFHQICTLIDFLKYKILQRSYISWPLRGVIIHDTEGWCKIGRKTDLWFGKWHEQYGTFSPEHLKVSKLGLWWDPLIQNRKHMRLRGVMCHDNEEWCKIWGGI